jgi:phosphoribosyl 1,2-cyclic phosphodiesterase
MRFVPFASGSSGNCTYIGSDAAHLLVDAGITRKKTTEGLQSIGLTLRDIDGIFITHEHSDHIGGLLMIAKQTDMPIYATAGTIRAILRNPTAQEIDPARFVAVRPDEKLTVKDITVDPMHISHDAADPVGYRFTYGHKKACVCTDLGCYTDYTVECLKDADVLLVESNHDVNMLQVGPYPYPLKQRILSATGHLSNACSGQMLSRVLNDHMKGIFLGHLSQENNLPELAFETVRLEIMQSLSPYHDHTEDLPIYIAKRREKSRVIEF